MFRPSEFGHWMSNGRETIVLSPAQKDRLMEQVYDTAQYVTWRGTSLFARELQKRGIKHTVSAPRHPQTLGKIERFWGTLWRECVEAAVFIDLEDARRRIGHFIDHYNFHRPHQGLDGLVPADRYFGSASEVRRTLEARIATGTV